MSNNVSIKCSFISETLQLMSNKKAQISIVIYEHVLGMPARFCAGLIPSIVLSRQLEINSITSVIRLIDPTSIANYCNGWKSGKSQFRDVVTKFLNEFNVNFFFDEAEQINSNTLKVLNPLGKELETATDKDVVDMIQRIKESGRRHGGEQGALNSVLYMTAHPFSWLDMYHHLVWKKEYSSENMQFINLMSKPESRFTVVRKFLKERRPDLCTKIDSLDLYMTICNTPCYIPLEGEPRFIDLINKGYDWCYDKYYVIRDKSSNHNRAYKDFCSLVSFLGLRSV